MGFANETGEGRGCMSKSFILGLMMLIGSTAGAAPGQGQPLLSSERGNIDNKKIIEIMRCPFVQAAREWDLHNLYNIEAYQGLLETINRQQNQYKNISLYYQLYLDGGNFQTRDEALAFQELFLEREPEAKKFSFADGKWNVHAAHEVYVAKLWQMQRQILEEAGVQSEQITEIKERNKVRVLEFSLHPNTRAQLGFNFQGDNKPYLDVFYEGEVLESDKREKLKQYLRSGPLQIKQKSVEVELQPMGIKAGLKQILLDSERTNVCVDE